MTDVRLPNPRADNCPGCLGTGVLVSHEGRKTNVTPCHMCDGTGEPPLVVEARRALGKDRT